MKSLATFVISFGIPATITGAAINHYFLKESPDIQYSVTAAIPLTFQASQQDRPSSGEFVQQIEVANSGNAEAKKIVVKIPRPVSEYHLVKHTAGEQVDIFNAPTGLEVSYTSLPPAAGFQITLKTSGSPLGENQIDVFHQGGKAKLVSPGARNNAFSFWGLLSVLLSL